MEKRQQVKITLIIAGVALWWGVPSVRQWQADKLVDELCAKDGGANVYEAVRLPKERFNQWGQIRVPDKKGVKPGDEYFSTLKTSDIIGQHNYGSGAELVVFRLHYVVQRVSDNKVLGEAVTYARRGGDPWGPWHPSSYSCHSAIELELERRTFMTAAE